MSGDSSEKKFFLVLFNYYYHLHLDLIYIARQ